MFIDQGGTGRQVQGHFFMFASSWTKVAQADKFRGHFFGFASLWTKVAQADKLKGRQCILLTIYRGSRSGPHSVLCRQDPAVYVCTKDEPTWYLKMATSNYPLGYGCPYLYPRGNILSTKSNSNSFATELGILIFWKKPKSYSPMAVADIGVFPSISRNTQLFWYTFYVNMCIYVYIQI